MIQGHQPPYRALVTLLVATAVGIVLLAGCGSTDAASNRRPSPTTPHSAPNAPQTQQGDAASGIAVPPIATHAARLSDLKADIGQPPASISIDSIGVEAPIVGVGVNPGTGELDVPPSSSIVAWFQSGATPGKDGSAVLAGHVDYDGFEGPFFRLSDLAPGATITVTYTDGSARRFTVTDRRQYAKTDLPVQQLFDQSGPSQLVLITCGGSFDRSARAYRDNVVVSAAPIG